MPSDLQTYENHRRFSPPYHFGLAPILLVILGWAIYRLVQAPSMDTAMMTLLAFTLPYMALLMRFFPLRVQDRLIRLEVRLRLKELLPPDLQPRIWDFSTAQLIGLRFASDRELPDLAAKVIGDRITNVGEIKRLIREWQPDHSRI